MSLKSCKSVYSGISLSMKKWDFIVLAYGYAVDYRYSIPPQYGCVTMTPTCKDGHACGDKSWLFQISHEDEQPISAHNTAEQTQDMSHVFMKAWVLLTEHPLFQFLYVQWSAPGYRQTDRLTRWTGLTPVLALTQSCCLLSGYIHTLVSQCGQTSDYSSSSIGLGHTMGKTSLIIPCSINSVCPVSVFQDNHCKWWHGHLTSMSTWVIWSYFAYYFWARH